ncbi:MAG: class I SAM-dependent methyltransferase [Planctomycetes bacterium]|nr:class I SAM-dependent methyltransferase [Planctomycetota bacterium]
MNQPASPSPAAVPLALDGIKSRQQQTWAAGDYSVVGTTLQLVGERLCEALDLRAGERVLDVAAGNGNASLAAARCCCDVVSTDFVPALLEAGRARAQADRLTIDFEPADAEALPFGDRTFDVAVSTFGVMFTPDPARAANELLRVCRPGGRIGLTTWTPAGFIGQLFAVVGRHVPPPPGLPSPAAWGTRARLVELFGSRGVVTITPREFVFRYRSPQHWLEVFREFYGPVHRAFAGLETPAQEALAADLLGLVELWPRPGDGTMAVPAEYLEVIVTCREGNATPRRHDERRRTLSPDQTRRCPIR